MDKAPQKGRLVVFAGQGRVRFWSCGDCFFDRPFPPSGPMDSNKPNSAPSRLPQIIVVVVAAVAAVAIARRDPGLTSEPAKPAYEMLAYLDGRVGVQENQKDVRCWSSFNKLQMFITNCEISEEAKSERIEQHMRLIQSIYDEAAKSAPGKKLISAPAVAAVLRTRFPKLDTAEGTQFNLGGGTPTLVVAEALKDYSDTIEPWRLLQTWASRQTDNKGKWKLNAQFNDEGLNELYEFFRAYDLALLRKAREHAMERKLGQIDAEAIAAAFAANPPKDR